MNTGCLVAILLTALTCTAATCGRTWTDVGGKHSVEAEMVGFQDGLVHLKKADGTVIKIALDKLSPRDQAFVRQSAATSATSPRGTPPAELRVDLGGGVSLELVLIPAGEFLMGSPDAEPAANCEDEKPRHKVQITQPFYLGKFEVTQEQWQAVMGYNPSTCPGPKNPVEGVSWEECQIFLERLNAKPAGGGGVQFCLPTEAQWEYACRAGATTRWSWGDEPAQLGDYAVWAGNAQRGSAPVGQKKPNAWGLYDMHGNVWEWCADWCAVDYYAQSPAQDPTGPTSPESVPRGGPSPVFRGGSWLNRRPEELRCAQRGVRCGLGGVMPSDDPWNGFRVAGRLGPAPAPGPAAGTQAGAAGAAPGGQGAAPDVLRFSYHMHPAAPFRVDSVAADGSVQIRPYWELWNRGRQETFLRGLSPDMLYATLAKAKGCSLLGFNGFPSPEMDAMQSYHVVPQPIDELRLFRVHVLEVLADGQPAVPLGPEAALRTKVGERRATVRLGSEAARQLKAGDQLFLFWPGGATPAQLQSVPDMLPLVDVREGAEGTAQRPSAGLNQSLNNLKQLGLALHNFHDVYKRFPPAVVYGPDGKPWHSWRVLILPFIEQRALYERYRFDEPWDGPNNKALLASIPPVYRDPVYPNTKDASTHYAGITGPGTAFPLEPRQPVNFGRSAAVLSAASAGMQDIRDGTANTIIVGSVSPERKIPWMKPEDVAFSDTCRLLGKPGSFATPHKLGERAAGAFLRVDGSVSAIRDDVDPTDWRRLLQIADGERLGKIPEFPSPTEVARRPEGTLQLEISLKQPGAGARLVIVPHVPPPLSPRQQSLNNFKQIGLAMLNFHDTFKQLPPAVVYGPDGKPWHSWRVLLLPFLDQRALYDRYRFDEPWDGPHNQALLESVPPVYRDPVYPVSKDAFTHYAAVTGPGTAFPLTPRNPVSCVPKPAGLSAATTRLADIRDGTSNSILVGPVSPERKIPWTKPEDVTWNDNFPRLGQPGSFAAPHTIDSRPAALFLRADGSVSMERADLDLAALRKLFQIADAPRPEESKAPVAVQPRATPGPLPVPPAARLPAFLTAERKQHNLLKDASFENAAGSDWSASTWRNNPQAVTRVDGGREGGRAVRLQTTVADDVQFRQRVAVKPQTRYLLSGWIKTQGVQIVEQGGTRGANLAVDGAGTWEATAPVLGDTDWTYVTLVFDSGQRTEIGVAARLGFFYSTVTGTAWYDDLCLIELDP